MDIEVTTCLTTVHLKLITTIIILYYDNKVSYANFTTIIKITNVSESK